MDAVEAIAKIVRSADAFRGDATWGGDDPQKELFESYKNFYRSKAKAILSLPEVREYFNKGE